MITVIIATKGRVESLGRLLTSLCHVNDRETIDYKIIVVNNAPYGPTAVAIETLIQKQAQSASPMLLCPGPYEPFPGKCRALNDAIRLARGTILAFLDDDVVVARSWLKAVDLFFHRHAFAAMQGAILFPPEMRNNEEFRKAWHRYKTVSYVNLGDKIIEAGKLNGANMAIRRHVFDRIGLFDERIGPGQGGLSDDTEFAQRLLRNKMHIGYMPEAVVYHEVDFARFTEEFFRVRHEAQGKSRAIYKNNSLFTVLADLAYSMLTFGWYYLLAAERQKYRAKGRYYHYRAMLKEKIKFLRKWSNTY